MNVKLLVGSGDRIGLFTLPFLAIGLVLNFFDPSLFSVGGPPAALAVLSAAMLIPGVIGWIWSAALILLMVPKQQLITNGPFAVVKHPLYTSVGLLVLPSIGLLLDSWLGIVIGVALYVGSRMFSPAEEEALSREFGPAWDEYCSIVKLPWL